MRTGAEREERRQQREILRELYPDYNPVRHDVWVMRYNKEQETEALRVFMQRRGINPAECEGPSRLDRRLAELKGGQS